jgi:uncharacterized protein DUF6475
MDDQDKKKFGQLLVTTAELYEKDLSSPVIHLYFKALKTYSIEQVQGALVKVIVSCKFFPKPVEIIELIGGGPGKLEDNALIQADVVVRSIKNVGAYRSVRFKDPVTTAVIQNCFGGWIKMCSELAESAEKWFRKDFITYYQAYFRRNIKSTDTLAGLIEADNSSKGYLEYIPEPLLIEEPGPKEIEHKTVSMQAA